MTPAFEIALGIAGESKAGNCVLIDDLAKTTRAGKEFGFYTILIGENSDKQAADAFLDDLSGLPDILAEFEH